MAGLVLVGALLMTIAGLLVHHSASHIFAMLASGLGVFLGVLGYGVIWSQRDLADATGSAMSSTWMVAGLVAGLAVGALVGWALRPSQDEQVGDVPPLPADAQTLDVPAGARIAWHGRATSGPVLVGIVEASLVLLVVLALTADPWMLAVVVPLALLLAVLAEVRVSVDSRGLRARSLVGLGWVDVPLDRIVSAEVTQVRPLAQYGGYGLRLRSDGTRALVTRSGEGLLVHRAGGPDVVVTVPRAEEAAAVLNTLVRERARA